ncbi:MAG: response regulator [Chloroflexota bacterium]
MGHILIVDDDPDILRLVRTGLTKAGFEVSEAEDGSSALAKIIERKPDLLITDAMMPNKDGYQLAAELRHRPETASLPIIMLTALQQELDALKAFQDGVDDFVTKPFSMPLLRARVTTLLNRAHAIEVAASPTTLAATDEPLAADRMTTGFRELDVAMGGGVPKGSNVLVIGETGSGKSSLARHFIASGLAASERCMIITLDDDPAMVRQSLGALLKKPVIEYEKLDYFRLVDCYSWTRGLARGNERFSVSGSLDLNQLVGIVSDAGAELGQTVNDKMGGRRVIDSVSSLFITFELPSVQRFLAQIARTAASYGNVTTLFLLEEGSIDSRSLSNIRYLMDVVLELKFDDRHRARIVTMKWSKFSRQWVSIEE